MNYYQNEIERIRKVCYSNDRQIKTVISTKSYIDHKFDEELNLDLLSSIRFTSKFHFLRLFKKYYGLTPKKYLIEKRIEKSKECLKSGMNITETCFSIGFGCPSSFSTLFKSKTGKAPSQFQKEQLSQCRSIR